MTRKTRTVVDVMDDLTGEAVKEGDGVTVVFGWNGQWLEIDLASQVAKTFVHLMLPYVNAARPYHPKDHEDETGEEQPSISGRKERNHREESERTRRNKAIRAWAPHNGFSLLTERGRIPRDVIAAWEAAVRESGGAWPETERKRPSWETDQGDDG